MVIFVENSTKNFVRVIYILAVHFFLQKLNK